jgi:hypothetical protein
MGYACMTEKKNYSLDPPIPPAAAGPDIAPQLANIVGVAPDEILDWDAQNVKQIFRGRVIHPAMIVYCTVKAAEQEAQRVVTIRVNDTLPQPNRLEDGARTALGLLAVSQPPRVIDSFVDAPFPTNF